jgi:hypothetical protein
MPSMRMRPDSGLMTLKSDIASVDLPLPVRPITAVVDPPGMRNRQALRTRVTFVAQDPVLFPGSIRLNLDPTEDYSDELCTEVLKLSLILPGKRTGSCATKVTRVRNACLLTSVILMPSMRMRPDSGLMTTHLDPSLINVSLRIPGGSTTAVIGRTGSGKSTLARRVASSKTTSLP